MDRLSRRRRRNVALFRPTYTDKKTGEQGKPSSLCRLPRKHLAAEVSICGQKYTLYVDYDRSKFHYLDLPGKVTYMRKRVNRDLVGPCRLALRHQRRLAVGLVVPAAVCAGISAASTFLNGDRAERRQDQTVFVNFVRQYMAPDFQRPQKHPNDPRISNFADWLYCNVRCGLSHGFDLEWGHIESRHSLQTYLGISTMRQPQINQDQLLKDFARGWNRYLDEVAASPASQLAQKFERRFNAVFHD
jgi:hypothetical protein